MLIPTLIAIALTLVAPHAVVASCAHGLDFIHPFSPAVNGKVAVPPFTYGITTGPFNWHNLNDGAYSLCGNGTNVRDRHLVECWIDQLIASFSAKPHSSQLI